MDAWTEDKSDEKENQPARKKLKLSLKKKKSEPEGGSRWQHLTAAEQEELFVKYVPKNTAASTNWAVTNFQDWKRSRNESLSDGEPVPEELLYSSDPKLLCKWLSLFSAEIRKKNRHPISSEITVYSLGWNTSTYAHFEQRLSKFPGYRKQRVWQISCLPWQHF